MALKSVLHSDLHIAGALSAEEMQIPPGTIQASDIAATAGIEATKLQHQHSVNWSQNGTVTAATEGIYVCRGATGIVMAVQVSCLTAPTGGDLAFTVDVKRGNDDPTAMATVLTAPISYSAAQADLAIVAGTIDTTNDDMTDGDVLEVVVAVSGSEGTQGIDPIVTVTIREDAE